MKLKRKKYRFLIEFARAKDPSRTLFHVFDLSRNDGIDDLFEMLMQVKNEELKIKSVAVDCLDYFVEI